MGESFRKSMNLLHTWSGVLVGSVLFAVLWMGTLCVFDREIDRWMMPASRLGPPPARLSLDRVVVPVAKKLGASSASWSIVMPGVRTPAVQLSYVDARGEYTTRMIDPATAKVLPEPGTLGGTGFFFPFHYGLNLQWMNLGYALVGVAGMSMLLLLVSGVIIHRKIFADFFSFRPRRTLPRSSLDLHNLTGVLLLPFHFFMPLSGMIIFLHVYFPGATAIPYGGDNEKFNTAIYGGFDRDKAKKPKPVVSLDALVRDAEKRWTKRLGVAAKADYIAVSNPGDAAGVVTVQRLYPEHSIKMDTENTSYGAADGRLLREHYAAPVRTVHATIGGLHFIQFDYWTLRWMYFLAGLGGCVMVATGFLFWLESRRTRHARQGLPGFAVVQGMTVGSTTGIVIATLAFFVANRLLPADMAIRPLRETHVFYAVWLLAFAHGWLRGSGAGHVVWREQAWAIVLFAVAAVALNWVTTGANPAYTVTHGQWAVLGMDLTLCAAAGIAAWSALRLRRTPVLKEVPHA